MASGRQSVARETHAAYRLACVGEALSKISFAASFVLIVFLFSISPLIALYEYDQQNEPTPNLTPEDLWFYAAFVVPGLAAMVVFAFLGPWIRRKRIELTPGIAEIDKCDRSSRRDRHLLGSEPVTPKGVVTPGGNITRPAPLEGIGKIVRYRSREGRRLGIVYRGEGDAVPTLRKRRRRHRSKKHGLKRNLWHRVRRAFGFSRKGKSRPAWWRAWLRLR